MAEHKEAWEHIAPELPPGAYWSEEGPYNFRVGWSQLGLAAMEDECRSTAAGMSWFAWASHSGITRKRYAELIAVEAVKQAAAKKPGNAVGYWVDYTFFGDGKRHEFRVASNLNPLEFRGAGPTLCDAAWACIQALGGK